MHVCVHVLCVHVCVRVRVCVCVCALNAGLAYSITELIFLKQLLIMQPRLVSSLQLS